MSFALAALIALLPNLGLFIVPAAFIYSCKIIAPAFRWQIATALGVVLLTCLFFLEKGCYCGQDHLPSTFSLSHWSIVTLAVLAAILPTRRADHFSNLITRGIGALIMAGVAALFYGAGIFGSYYVLDMSGMLPNENKLPTDAELRELFIAKRDVFNLLAKLAIDDSRHLHGDMFIESRNPLSFIWPSTRPEYQSLLQQLGRPVTVYADSDGVRFDFASGVFYGKLRIAKSWAQWSKSIEFDETPPDWKIQSHPKNLNDFQELTPDNESIALAKRWFLTVYISDSD